MDIVTEAFCNAFKTRADAKFKFKPSPKIKKEMWASCGCTMQCEERAV